MTENEPVNSPGYNRRRLTSDSWAITEDLSGIKAETELITYRNNGPDEWPDVNVQFIISGDDRLLGWTYLRTIRHLFPGDEERLTFSFRFPF